MKTLLLRFLLGRGVGGLQESISKSVRHAVTAFGGGLVTDGWLTGDDVNTVAGAAVIVASVAVSMLRTILGNKLGKKGAKASSGAASLLLALYVGLIALGFAARPAAADLAHGEPLFTYTLPVEWTNGAALTAAQVTGFQLECTGTAALSKRLPATPLAYTELTALKAAGPYSCSLALYAKQTPTAAEIRSAFTGPLPFIVPSPAPGAPAGFSVD